MSTQNRHHRHRRPNRLPKLNVALLGTMMMLFSCCFSNIQGTKTIISIDFFSGVRRIFTTRSSSSLLSSGSTRASSIRTQIFFASAFPLPIRNARTKSSSTIGLHPLYNSGVKNRSMNLDKKAIISRKLFITSTSLLSTSTSSNNNDNSNINGNMKKIPTSNTGWIKPESILSITLPKDSPTTKTNTSSTSSPIEPLLIRDRLTYIKRDDALHLPSSNISGNKARKFYSLNEIPAQDFPECIVSYGGPQSNAMVALAALVCAKNRELGLDDGGGDEGWDGDGDGNFSSEGSDGAMLWELGVEETERGIRSRAEKEDFLPNLTSLESEPLSLSSFSPGVESNYNDDDDDGGSDNSAERSTHQEQSTATTTCTTETKSNEQPTKKRFIYYTKAIPRYLRKYPNGNFLRALALGIEIQTLSHSEYNRLFGGLHGGSVMAPADLEVPVPGKSLWMPQGGACSLAQPGSDNLAREIIDYWAANGKNMPLAICVPGGTCTTALLLHRSINQIMAERVKHAELESPLDIRVVVIPCVGDDEYALRQMRSLDKSMGGLGRLEDVPDVLRPRSDVEYGSARRRSGGYFTFGEPAKAILQCFDEMNEAGLFLDLLYGAPAWSLLLQHWRSRDYLDCPIAGRQVMYVHSGGLEGIASQMTRYKHKGLLDTRTIQSA